MKRRISSLSTVSLIAAIGLAACGGSSLPATTQPVDTTQSSSDETTPEGTAPASTTPGGITSFSDIQPAVIQIEALGTIRSAEVGITDGSGRGSGFIISSDGLAVTNNHVVTGAATLEVFIGGDTSTSYNATVLGVSECNDLAVIDINESEPLPSLGWYDGKITTGTEIYAAGFPLGETEYTLTRGIVSKVSASGETNWASLDSVLEHDANIQPGNSGGPLVAADGTVVGINYRGRDVTGTTQFFAIDKDIAQRVVDNLKKGDFESLGINGEAVVDEEAGIAGIWVSAVAPGSPASELDILAGDIIQSMNGLPVGTDGTMSAYCDVLRTSRDKPIQVEILRYDTSEVLRGELNGSKPLKQVFSFADAVEDDVTVDTSGGSTGDVGGASYGDYTTITDDSGLIAIDVPSVWTDVSTTPLTLDDGTQVPVINASPSIADSEVSYGTPSLLYAILGPLPNLDETLASFAPGAGECTDGGISDYSDDLYSGRYQLWLNCGGGEAFVVTLVAVPGDSEYTAIISLQGATEADLEALDQAFATFAVFAS